jgi:hypothetical protein
VNKHDLNLSKMQDIAEIVADWNRHDVPSAGALLRIRRVMDDQAPAEYRQPLTAVDL